jgi:hypothetical protein
MIIKIAVELYQQVKKQPIAIKEIQQEDIKPKPIKKNATKRIRKSPKKI